MSKDEASYAATTLGHAEAENCQPCILQNKKAPALYWCSDCNELLCKSCHGHHRVLTATKSHVPYTLEEYLVVRDVVSKIDLKCKSHTDKQLDFFCKFHQSFCCVVCKSEHKPPSCDLQDINKSFTDQDKERILQKEAMVVSDLHTKMRTLLVNENKNSKTLEQYRNTFLDDIKKSRHDIEKYLDQFEEKIKAKFEEQFGISRTAIMYNITDIESRMKEVVKRQSIIEKLKHCHKIPVVADFHTSVLIMKKNEEDAAFLKNVNPVEFIRYEIESSVDEKSQIITLNDKSEKLKLSDDDKIAVVCDHAEHENSSSTVEEEAVVLLHTIAQEQDWFSDCVSSMSQFETSLRRHSETCTQEEHFEKLHKFYVQKYNKDIEIICVRIMPDGKIVMTETSDYRLLAYYENGQKIGEVKFDDKPGDVAKVLNNQVAVAVEKMVFIVDTDRLEIVKAINMYDFCVGIAFAKEQIFVNCCHKGLTVMLQSGKVIRTIPFLKGDLYICALDDDSIMSVKDSRNVHQMVFRFDMKNNRLERFHCPDLARVNGIVFGGHTRVFISSVSNQIWELNYKAGVWKQVILDGLSVPYSIYFDEHDDKLIVANNEGRSLYFYKRVCRVLPVVGKTLAI